MKLQVSSFARKDQDLWDTPAAVFVITRQDIEHSAASSIPELLRGVPGVQVAQLNASTWAVSARGFNSQYASKLLVLIDGRTIYSEIYSGVHWDQDDLPLDEIERIEVIRGPGAAVWGTNAVNGVINIITRRARSTLGYGASAQISRIDNAFHLQYGGSLGDRVQYRGYGLYVRREPFDLVTGVRAFDGETSLRGGGRIDWQRSKQDWFTFSGNLYGGSLKQTVNPEFSLLVGPDNEDKGSIAGGYLLTRWEHKLPRADTALQVYFDDSSRHELGDIARARTFDVDYQQHHSAGERNDFVWGGEFRFTDDHISGQPVFTDKPDFQNFLVDAFVQDEIGLIPQKLVLTLGSKVQQGTLAGFQIQPSARLLWSPSEKQSFWGAISRAAAAPSIQDTSISVALDLGVAAGLPIQGFVVGDPTIKPETVVSYEAGYRRKLSSHLSLDVASFVNQDHRLFAIEEPAPVFVAVPTPHLLENSAYTNGLGATTAGIEGSASWRPLSSLSFQAGYTWMEAHSPKVGSGDPTTLDAWNSPRNAFTASALWNLPRNWNINASYYFVQAISLPGDSEADPVPHVLRGDLKVAHKVGRLNFEAGGTNLFTPRHLEFGYAGTDLLPIYVPRSLFVRAAWTF